MGPARDLMARALLLLVRLGSTIALLLVATYYLLASIPFSYYHFLQFAHFWWLPAFIKFHPLIALASVTGLLATLGDLAASAARQRRYLAVAGLTMIGCMAATLWVPGLDSYEVAALLCFWSIGVIGACGGIDLAAHRHIFARPGTTPRPGGALIGSAMLAGALSATGYLSRAMLIERGQAAGLGADEIRIAALVTVGGHLAVFGTAALAAVALRAIARRRAWGAWEERLALCAYAAALLAWGIRRSVLSSLILSEIRAITLAAALGVTIVLSCQAILARRLMFWRDPRDSPSTASRTVTPPAATRWGVVAALALLISLSVVVLPDQLRFADWGFTLQKLSVLATWAASVALVMLLPESRRLRLALAGVVAAILLSQITAATTHARRMDSSAAQSAHGADLGLAVDRYATIDTSFMVVLDLLRPVVSDSAFFALLRSVGSATDDGSLHAVALRLTGQSGATTSLPNIFIIVVDSLRPDYLSAYNPEATFTPAIGAFARESLVWRQAFTPYTGTALSEPALWAGGLIQRRMYIHPFSAVNNLERFISEGAYRRYISMDAILNTLLESRSNLVPLDSHLAHPEKLEEMFKFDLCPTLSELTADLDRDARRTEPIFFFTQPQNLHIRVIGGIKSPHFIETRTGGFSFFKPAADAVTRIDACFGTFIDYLKARHLFDDSIIVLTSDHGDAYGEDGLWGHAFYTVPATVRIPLIIHVPERLRRQRYWDPQAVALLTDVTPTLYALSGYRLAPDQDLLGRPLLTSNEADARAYEHDRYLMQSSYNLNFGLLDGHANWLYVANATASTEMLFDLHDPPSRRRLTPSDRLKYRKWLLDRLAALNAYYHAEAPPPR